MTQTESRRNQVVARLRAVRKAYERCVADVTPETGMRGTEWSIADLLQHLNDTYYHDMARRFLTEESPRFESTYSEEAEWRRYMRAAFASVDDALAIAASLTPQQMARVGSRQGRPFTALDALDECAAHFEEHLAQLRNEVRPREGLPSAS